MSVPNGGRGLGRGRGWSNYYGRGRGNRGANKGQSGQSTAGSSHGANTSKCSSQASTRQRVISVMLDRNVGPYAGWNLYFPQEGIIKNNVQTTALRYIPIPTLVEVIRQDLLMRKNRVCKK